MTFMKKMMSATAALALTAGAAAADPAIVFDLGGKFDKSFNESAFNGAMRWAEETGGSFAEVELQSDAQREQALRRFAESGANPIVMAGFAFATALNEVAADYPDTKFVIIDMVVSNILLAMGAMMVPPMLVSLPLKILLFVAADGWSRLLQSLILSYA